MNNIFENDEESSISKQKASYDLVVTPKDKTPEDVIKALDNIDNYGQYISNIRTDKAGLQKALDDYFGPSLPVKKKQLEKERGKPFPPKTKQAIDDFIRSKTSKPDMLKYVVQDNTLIFPKNSNPNKELTKAILKTVLGKANIEYSVDEKESLDENVFKLKKLIKEEVKKVLKENEGGLREELRDEYGDILPKNIVIQILKEHDASIDEYKKDTNFSLNLDKLMDWLGY